MLVVRRLAEAVVRHAVRLDSDVDQAVLLATCHAQFSLVLALSHVVQGLSDHAFAVALALVAGLDLLGHVVDGWGSSGVDAAGVGELAGEGEAALDRGVVGLVMQVGAVVLLGGVGAVVVVVGVGWVRGMSGVSGGVGHGRLHDVGGVVDGGVMHGGVIGGRVRVVSRVQLLLLRVELRLVGQFRLGRLLLVFSRAGSKQKSQNK